VKRYRVDFGYGRYYFEERADGDWIRFTDHEAEIERLRADNARLRKRCAVLAVLQYGWPSPGVEPPPQDGKP